MISLKRNMLSQLTFLGGSCSLQSLSTKQALRLCVKETKGPAIQKVRLQWADDAHAAEVESLRLASRSMSPTSLISGCISNYHTDVLTAPLSMLSIQVNL
jgi:hypothetical protein